MILKYSIAVVSVTLMSIGLSTASASGQSPPKPIDDLRVVRGSGTVAEAYFADATDRYRHFVLGSRYEPSTLVVTLKSGAKLTLAAGADAVFEDRQPRLADLDGDGTDEIVIVKAYLDRGAALTVVGLRDGQLRIVAETPPTGRPNTWLNPAGIADFDGDGRLDVAYVQMPHVLGLLRVVTLRQGRLAEIAKVDGVSNHQIGSKRLGLSAVFDFNKDGAADLAIPTLDRKSLRVLSFKGGAKELRKVALPGRAAGDFRLERRAHGVTAVIIPIEGGGETVVSLPPF